jgi:tRNA threonylcarbamoyladenosine biosynthesis protein TsaE
VQIIETHAPESTQAFARELALSLLPGTVLLLEGGLGAGKTCFCQGLAEGLQVPRAEVCSPTYTLVHEHQGGRLPFFHCDLYRLAEGEPEELGLDEMMRADGVCAIEWPQRLGGQKPPLAWTITFETLGPEHRRIIVERP